MPQRRVRFATIAVFGLGAFVAASVGVTLYVSGATGLRTTQTLLAGQAEELLDSLERVIEAELEPVRDQALWVASAFAEGRVSLARRDQLDAFMLGLIGATPQVSGAAIVDAMGHSRRWSRDQRGALSEDWSTRATVRAWIERGRETQSSSWREPAAAPKTATASVATT